MLLKHYIDEVLNKWHVSFSHAFFFDESKKVINCNCSSVYNFYFQKYYPEKFSKWMDINNYKKIKAKDYFYYINKEIDFFKISKVYELRPFDFICWKKINPPQSGDTGHILVVLDIISYSKENLILKVFDVSKLPHTNDSRKNPGAGIGEMEFILKDDYPVAYKWSQSLNKIKFTQILIGRY